MKPMKYCWTALVVLSIWTASWELMFPPQLNTIYHDFDTSRIAAGPQVPHSDDNQHPLRGETKVDTDDSSSMTTQGSSDDDNNNYYYSDNNLVLALMTAPLASLDEPHQVLREYISQHGVGATTTTTANHPDTNNKSSKYIILSYHCPNRAGNIFSNVLNAMVLAIVSNRTLLWRFDTGSGKRGRWFELADCDRVLHRARWIAPFWEHTSNNDTPYFGIHNAKQQKQQQHPPVYWWRQRGQTVQACISVLNQTDMYQCMEQLKRAPAGTAAKLGEPANLADHRVVDIRGLSGCIHSEIAGWKGRFDMRVPSCSDYVRAAFLGNGTGPSEDLIDQGRIDMLFRYGMDFLYGMLFRHAFSLTDELLASVETMGGTILDPTAYSVAVHTRHVSAEDQGTDVARETACLSEVLSKRGSKQQSCQVLIMSDRERSNDALMEYATAAGCQGITVLHNVKVTNNTFQKEHGPFEGAGYFQDMAIVTQARHGFVTTTRSSSGLLQNLMVYDRTMENVAGYLLKAGARGQNLSFVAHRHGLEICIHQFEGPARPTWPTSN
jgi:hypothetical protein